MCIELADNETMALSEKTVWIWSAVGVAVGTAAALYGFIPQGRDAQDTAAAGTPLNSGRDAPGAVTAPDSAAVAGGAASSAPVADLIAANGRFKVVGVMNSGNERAVLITVDGNPARLFRVGDTVDTGIVVRDVSERGATLGPREGGAALALELSQAPPSATVAAPMPKAQSVPRAPLAEKSVQAQEVLRKLGSRHAPIQPQTAPAPQKPVEVIVAPVDDGRWRPLGQ